MAIQTNSVLTDNNRINHDPDGIQDTFQYDFQVDALDLMFVYADGLDYLEPFSMTGLGDPEGGDVIFDTPPDGSIDVLTLMRIMPLTQEKVYPVYGPFPAKSHENALDKLTWIDQQLQEQIDRALLAPVDADPTVDYTMPPYELGKGIMWSEEDPKRFVNSNDTLNGIIEECTAQAVLAAESAVDSAGFATQSSGFANASSDSADESAGFATQSSGFADDSSDSAERAQEWAENPEDVPVVGDEFSAHHWAIKAAEIVVGSSVTKSTRQTMLAGPDMEATPLPPEEIETAGTETGDLTNQYLDVGVDMLTGSRGGMVLEKDKGINSTIIQSSILSEARSTLITDATSIEGTSADRLQQFLANGVQLDDNVNLTNANLYTFQTTHKTVLDGNVWHYNPTSGFAMCVYEGTGVARELLHPMGKAPLFWSVKNTENGVEGHFTGRKGTSDYMVLNTDSNENPSADIWPDEATDTYFSIGNVSQVNGSGDAMFLFGWFGDDLSDLMVSMSGERGVTAHWIYPAGSGAQVVDTGITSPIEMLKWKSLSTGDWNILNLASGYGNFTILNDTDAEATQVAVSIIGSEVTFTGSADDIMFTVVGSTGLAKADQLQAATEVLRKVGTGLTGHRVDLGADYVSGDAGGMVFGRDVGAVGDNFAIDTINGAGQNLLTNDTDALTPDATLVEAFLSTGMQAGSNPAFNDATNTNQYSAFNTTHKTTTIDGLEWEYNPLTGFAMCKYVGDGIAGRTLTHPMGKKLRKGWFKNLDALQSWRVYLDSVGAAYVLYLDTTGAAALGPTVWNNTEPDDTTITLGTDTGVNGDTVNFIFYGWFGDELTVDPTTPVTGELGVSAFWQHDGIATPTEVDTGIENITTILYKASSTATSWYWLKPEGNTRYFLDTTGVEADNGASVTVEGSVVHYAGNPNIWEFIAFGSNVDPSSAVDDQVHLQSSEEDPTIVSFAKGFDSIGNVDQVLKLVAEQSLTVTGAEGQKFLYMKNDGVLYFSDTRPEYLRDYVPQPQDGYVFDIIDALMYDPSGVLDPAVFIGDCWLNSEGNVYDVKTYVKGDVALSAWFAGVPSTTYVDENPFGHKEVLAQLIGEASDGKELVSEELLEIDEESTTISLDATPDAVNYKTNIRRNF